MGGPEGPPMPPALRAPAEPWRFASVGSGATKCPPCPPVVRSGPAKACRSSVTRAILAPRPSRPASERAWTRDPLPSALTHPRGVGDVLPAGADGVHLAGGQHAGGEEGAVL